MPAPVPTAPSLTATEVVRQSLRGRRVDGAGLAFQGLLLLALLASLGILVVLMATVAERGVGVLVDRGPAFLTHGLSASPAQAGVWQGLQGSFLIMLFVVVLAFPVGIGAAVYLSEYAPDNRLTRAIELNIRNLAGVPSVVYGLLALSIFVRALADLTGGRSVIAGGLALAVLVLPIVIITASEALRAVPASIREAGYGVGATRWEVVRHHVLPSAAPGILTGTVLALSRALGETAPLILVGATATFYSTGAQGLADRLQGAFSALPMIVYGWSTRPQAEFRDLASAAIIVLLAVILAANATAVVLRNRYERTW